MIDSGHKSVTIIHKFSHRKILEEVSVCYQVRPVGEIKDSQSHLVHKVCQVYVDGKLS